LNPAATRWIDLDLQRLRARSADEWRRAHALAKAIALHWIRALGGDLDDVVQEALTALDAELDRLHANAVPPSCALCTIFFQKAAHVLRSRRTQDKLRARLPAEPSPEPRRPDLALDHQKLAHAYEVALRSELESGSETDREILHATLLGRNGKEISVSIGLAESTVSWRKGRIVERLRAQLREALEEPGAAALTMGDEER
jgi:DNA-directed RNA polymerase specialized sigma24 family protein